MLWWPDGELCILVKTMKVLALHTELPSTLPSEIINTSPWLMITVSNIWMIIVRVPCVCVYGDWLVLKFVESSFLYALDRYVTRHLHDTCLGVEGNSLYLAVTYILM